MNQYLARSDALEPTGSSIEKGTSVSGDRPLAGVRVLDLTHAAAGPFATMLMGDLGAEIIKIERPGEGDLTRGLGDRERLQIPGTGMSDYFLALNRNKESVALDLSSPEGVEAALSLAAVSDVVIQNHRPGAMARLGLGFDAVRSRKSDIIYCSLSGYAEGGPWSDRIANDVMIQSVSGLMGITGEPDGMPVRIGAPLVDFSAGLFCYSAIATALYARPHHPDGQQIQVSMLDAAIAFMANFIPAARTLNRRIPRLGRGHSQIAPYGSYRCADGSLIIVGAFDQRLWCNLCRAIDQEAWIDNPLFQNNSARLANIKALDDLIGAVIATRDREDWLELFESTDVPAHPLLELHEALRTEQAVAQGVAVPISTASGDIFHVAKNPMTSANWGSIEYRMPPELGADGAAVLERVGGLAAEQVSSLLSSGILQQPG